MVDNEYMITYLMAEAQLKQKTSYQSAKLSLTIYLKEVSYIKEIYAEKIDKKVGFYTMGPMAVHHTCYFRLKKICN